MTLSFSAKIGELAGSFRIFLPLELLASGNAAPAGEIADNLPSGLRWRFPVSAGFVDLTSEEIGQVGLGDLLVIQPGAALLFPNDFASGWTMLDDSSNFVRFHLDKPLEGGMQVEGGETTTRAGVAVVQNLPVRVHVILGEKDLTLAEVQSLNPGTIVEFDINKAAPVRLMVNGRMLGEGELVEVEGKLAVKVLGWRSA